MSEELFGELMSSLRMTGTMKWMPLLAATRVVMMKAIMQRARTVACE